MELPVLLLIDCAGCEGMEEALAEGGGDSKRNEGEARAAMAHVWRLMEAGVSPGDIGVITPYSAQASALPRRSTLRAGRAPRAQRSLSVIAGSSQNWRDWLSWECGA